MYEFTSWSGHPVPLLGPEHYKSYMVAAPPRTHWRPATCEEYDCAGFLYGFVTTVDLTTELGQQQAHYIRHDKTRNHTERRVSLEMTEFVFGPGNECFSRGSHKVPLERPPRLLVLGGDWRGNPQGTFVQHTRMEYWVEDFGEHQQRLADKIGKG